LAQTFWTAIVAWSTCFVVTIAVSLVSRPRPEEELRGLVYGFTAMPDDRGAHWYQRPAWLAVLVLACTVALNVVFF
jgi:SSS family solute:Na+ symporter